MQNTHLLLPGAHPSASAFSSCNNTNRHVTRNEINLTGARNGAYLAEHERGEEGRPEDGAPGDGRLGPRIRHHAEPEAQRHFPRGTALRREDDRGGDKALAQGQEPWTGTFSVRLTVSLKVLRLQGDPGGKIINFIRSSTLG
mgnify:CR=1 FL=1